MKAHDLSERPSTSAISKRRRRPEGLKPGDLSAAGRSPRSMALRPAGDLWNDFAI